MLQLAQEHLRNLLPPRLMQSMSGFLTRRGATSTATDNPQSTSLEREWQHKVRVVATSQPLLPPTIAPGVLEEVSEALYANLWLELDYQNAAGKRQRAKVMPWGWPSKARACTWCAVLKTLTTERSLALHRIRKAQASTLSF